MCVDAELLLPCPFCGNEAVRIIEPKNMNDSRRAVECLECGSLTIYPTIDELFVYWNMRAKTA